MYAIIRTGGKQLRVKKGDVIDVELLGVSDGEEIEFSDILFINDGEAMYMGTPVVMDFTVKGKVIGHSRGKKVKSMKYQRRQNERHHIGHRQHYNRVEIINIASSKAKTKVTAKKEEKNGS